MSNLLIDDSILTGIADAIRAKTGSGETILCTDLANQISKINTHQATLQTKTATVNGQYLPDAGYDGLSELQVNVPCGVEEKTITENGEYTPTAPNIGFSKVTVNIAPPYHLNKIYGSNSGLGEKTKNLSQVNEFYNKTIDTRDNAVLDFSIIAKDGSVLNHTKTAIESPGHYIMRISATEDEYSDVYLKYSGLKRDMPITTLEVTGGLSADSYTVCFTVVSNNPKSMNGLHISNIMLVKGVTEENFVPYGYLIPITVNEVTYNEYVYPNLGVTDYITPSGLVVYSDGTTWITNSFDIAVDNKSDVTFETTEQPSALEFIRGKIE